MTVKINDVITEDFVRETVEEVVEEELVYQEAFRTIDATGIESNSYTFYIDEDDMGSVDIVGELQEFPQDESHVRELTVHFDKFGKQVTISMEAMEDGILDMKARQIEDMARQMAEEMNDQAFETLDNNVDATVGDNDDTLSFSDIRDAMVAVRSNNYSPDTLIVDLDGYGDLLTDSNFNRATEQGDDVVRSGQIGEVAGMDVIIDNTHDIADGNGAFVLDSDAYGYELTRTPISTNEFPKPEIQADVMQIYTRKAWTAIFTEAAVKVDA